jgi:hypothetical protein
MKGGEHKKMIKNASMSKREWSIKKIEKEEFFPVSPTTSLFRYRSIHPVECDGFS